MPSDMQCMPVYHACLLCVTGDILKHLYCMCDLLRPSDNIKLVSFLLLLVCCEYQLVSFLPQSMSAHIIVLKALLAQWYAEQGL